MTEPSPHQKELDILQSALDIAGIEPTIGTIADVSNTIISLLRAAKDTEKDSRNKHLIDAGISAVSIIPFGDLVKLIKLRKLRKPAVKAARMVKTGVSKMPKSYEMKESMKISEIKGIIDEIVAEELGDMKPDATDAASAVSSQIAQNMFRKKASRAMKQHSDLSAQKWVQAQKQLPQKKTLEELDNTNEEVWLYQKGTSHEIWAKPIQSQKSGGDKAIVFTSYDGSMSGNAAIKSTRSWYPAPQKIEASQVPDIVKQKIQRKAQQMGITLEGVGYVYAKDRAKDPKSIKKPGGGTEHWRIKFQSSKDLKKHGNTETSKVNENMKNKELKQLIRESIEEVEQEIIKETQDQEENMLMKRIQSYAHWGAKNVRKHPAELERVFQYIVKEIDALIKLSSEGGPVPIKGVVESERKSPLGVTEETISKTKTLLDQMISQRRKK